MPSVRFVTSLMAAAAAVTLRTTCAIEEGAITWASSLSLGDLARDIEPLTCHPIPRNLTLCHDVAYPMMRLPNLLDHETMSEVIQQSNSWLPLLKLRCHPDSKIFLCSLFAPVCLGEEHSAWSTPHSSTIYPCRSLCQMVKLGCEHTMGRYGYPWPKMLDCGNFPADNDMCIRSQAVMEMEEKEKEKRRKAETERERGRDSGSSGRKRNRNKNSRNKNKGEAKSGGGGGSQTQRGTGTDCNSEHDARSAFTCREEDRPETIMGEFCRADFVAKLRFRRAGRRSLQGRKVSAVFKAAEGIPRRATRRPRLKPVSPGAGECCSQWVRSRRGGDKYLVMAVKSRDGEGDSLTPTLVMPWTQSKAVKKVRRMFKQHQIHCGSETGRGKGPDGADHDRHLPVGLQKKQNGNNEAPEKTKRRREKEKEKEVDDDERRIEGDDGENKITHEAQDSSTTMTTTTSGVGAKESGGSRAKRRKRRHRHGGGDKRERGQNHRRHKKAEADDEDEDDVWHF